MAIDLLDLITEAERVLRRGDADRAVVLLSRLRRIAARSRSREDTLEADVDRYRDILARTLEVTVAQGLSPVSSQVLDGVISIVQARRGFLGLVSADGTWSVLAARHAGGEAIADPTAHLSTSIVADCLAGGQAVVTQDAGDGDFAAQASVTRLELRSVACLPLQRNGRTEGFIYLDNPLAKGLFDDAALAAVQAWLPFLSMCIARAVAESEPAPEGLPGVVTRSPRMQAELQELGRIARFDVSVLLTGETGTGKSLVAQRLHAASSRRSKPFVHVNCGALPESLIEGELFGAEAGAYTGASQRRVGKFEAADGGTLFLDELDTMPLSCQVKLLVALQERRIQRLGSNRTIPVDVRVIAAMGSDPNLAIDEGKLREDLYYRLAVFVAHLPPLRERRDDVPLLARHFLAESAQRYGLPPLTLSPRAVEDLMGHDWPGNVRELSNTLDRAALLARDGTIERVDFRRRRGAPGRSEPAAASVMGALERLADRFVVAMDERRRLRSLDSADVFRALVLLQAVRRQGGRAEAFHWLGQGAQVRNRNHNRVVKREVGRVHSVASALGEQVSDALLDAAES